jgi:lipoprotein-anchoring transpeptidase ErfK/SrfK
MGTIRMKLGTTALAVTSTIAGAAWATLAAAQSYPPYGSPPTNAPPPIYRGAPADDDDVIIPAPSRDPYVYGSRPGAPQPGGAYWMPPPGPAGSQQAREDPYGGGPYENPMGVRPPAGVQPYHEQSVAALPPEDQPETGEAKLPPQFRRQLVDYPVREQQPGTIIIDTPHTFLYLMLGQGKALRYGIGVGREGFTWSGTERVSKMSEWPDWYPPVEMIQRQPYLPRMMAGGPGNPLGARALYLGSTVYRIHGTNQPSTIGQFVSSGCIRLTNEDIEDLYGRVTVGTKVIVLPGHPPASAANAAVPAVH